MLRIIVSFLALIIVSKSFAQTNHEQVIQGKITDAETKLPIEAASITVPIQNANSISSEDGKFTIVLKNIEKHQLTISAIGYRTKTIDLDEFFLLNKTILLEKGPLQLREIVVASAAGTQVRNISKVDILLRGINNSQEVLRIVPGLFIGQHAGGGKAEQIFLRGFDIDHGTDINISVDGMPVNMVSHAHGQGYADLHFVIPELIEHVHFDKGPYKADKGNLATAGSVSFYTKTKLPTNFSKAEAGMFNTFRNVNGINLLNKNIQNQSLYVASEILYSKGYFDHPQNLRRLNLFAKYFQNINNKNILTISASTFKSKWNASGQIPERAVANGRIGFFGAIDPNEGGNTGRTNFNAQLKTNLQNNIFIKNQLFFTAYDFDLFSNFTFFKIDEINGDQIRQKEKRSLFGYNGSFHQNIFLNAAKWTNEIGASIRIDAIRGNELSRTKNRIRTLQHIKSGNINELNTSAYASESISWNNRFIINGVLRLDHFRMLYKDHLHDNATATTNEVIFSPKINLTFQPDSKTEIYIKAGRGFHSNDARVAIFNKRKTLPAAFGVDAGTQLKLSKNLLLDAALWYLAMDQEFVYVGDEGIIEQGGKTRRLGTDLSIRYQPFSFLFIDGNFNYAHARCPDAPKEESYIPLAPVFTSTGGITLKTKKGWNGSLNYRYMNDRPANESNSVAAKGYFITDAHLNYSNKKVEAGITMHNLFDKRWKETQFETESRLKGESEPVSEIHFTPGAPFFIKATFTYFF